MNKADRKAFSEMTSEDLIRSVTRNLLETLIAKNRDYGATAVRNPLLAPGLSATTAILVRMSDKVMRLQNLLSGNKAVVKESLSDTVLDLAGYAILWECARLREEACAGDLVQEREGN